MSNIFRFKLSVFLIIFTMVFYFKTTGQNYPGDRIFYNTFKIVADSGIGTCFRVSFKNKNWMVTVRHIFSKKNKSGDTVTYLFEKEAISVKGKVYFPENMSTDIAVLEFDFDHKFKALHYDLADSYTLGRDCYFVGFPLAGKLYSTFDNNEIGLIKKAIISGISYYYDTPLLYLDAQNLEGFSGAPILTYNDELKDFVLIGVIGGFIAREIQLNDRDLFQENLGITFATPIKQVYNLLMNIKMD